MALAAPAGAAFAGTALADAARRAPLAGVASVRAHAASRTAARIVARRVDEEGVMCRKMKVAVTGKANVSGARAGSRIGRARGVRLAQSPSRPSRFWIGLSPPAMPFTIAGR